MYVLHLGHCSNMAQHTCVLCPGVHILHAVMVCSALQGKAFAELPYYFPDGSVFGLVSIHSCTACTVPCLLRPCPQGNPPLPSSGCHSTPILGPLCRFASHRAQRSVRPTFVHNTFADYVLMPPFPHRIVCHSHPAKTVCLYHLLYTLMTSSISMCLQVNSARNRCLINPTPDTVVERGDQLMMMRPTCIASHAYKPLKKPVKVDKGKRQAA